MDCVVLHQKSSPTFLGQLNFGWFVFQPNNLCSSASLSNVISTNLWQILVAANHCCGCNSYGLFTSCCIPKDNCLTKLVTGKPRGAYPLSTPSAQVIYSLPLPMMGATFMFQDRPVLSAYHSVMPKSALVSYICSSFNKMKLYYRYNSFNESSILIKRL